MLCPQCRANCLADDEFCRHCGANLTTPSRSLVPVTANLPAVLQHPQLPRVAAGVGALAFGFGLELLRRNLLTRLAKPVRATPKLLPAQSIMDLKDALTPQSVRTQKLQKGYEIQETAIYISRVIRKVR